jgi:general secretion pathway protein E
LYGETVVLRILDRTAVEFDYAKLGLPAPIIREFHAALALPNGIVLVTGPTGSGKTTTLYTGLLALNSIERKIMTVEDPIEFRLQGITQMQVHEQIGLTFEEFLSAIVRQDPNVIMVGEIRNRETAQIAANAALLGRLVLSTLHTNSAASAVTRLRDMGLEDYTLAAVLRGVLAQRLVRRLCPDCRRPAPVPAELVRRFDLLAGSDGTPPMLNHPVGCAKCRQSGYRGRFAIAEFLTLNTEIENLIYARADHNSVERAAVAAGMKTMFQYGLDAVLAGDTTIEEVVRGVRAEG